MGRGGGGAVMAVNNSELEAIVFLSHNPSVGHPKPTGRGGGGGEAAALKCATCFSLSNNISWCSSSAAFDLF